MKRLLLTCLVLLVLCGLSQAEIERYNSRLPMLVHRGRQSPEVLALSSEGTRLTQAEIEAITKAEIIINGERVNSESCPACFNFGTGYKENGQILVDFGSADFTLGRDRASELIVYTSSYPDGRVFGTIDIEITDAAEEGASLVDVLIEIVLNTLSDVEITDPQDNEILIYNSSTGNWENGENTGATGSDDQTASEVETTVTNFDNNLSAADDTVQKALETLDEIAGGGGSTDPDDLNGDTVDDDKVDASIVEGKENWHGVESYGTFSFNSTSHILSVSTMDYWFNGAEYSTASPVTCDIDSFETLTTNTLYYFYFDDATGTLKCNDTGWSLVTNVPIASVMWNGSDGAIVNECHSYTRDIPLHIWAHQTIGSRYFNDGGGAKTLPTTSTDNDLEITTVKIYDEDLLSTITSPATARPIYQASSGVYTWATPTSLPYTGTNADPTWLDTDDYTLKSVSDSDFVCYWIYATPDTSTGLWMIPTQAATAYNTITLARAEAPPALYGLNLTPEMKLIWKFIFRGDGEFQEAVDYRQSATLPSGGAASLAASAVTFLPDGSISSTNVQGAIVEVRDEAESSTSNNIDPDRLDGDTVDDDKVDQAILPFSFGTGANDAVQLDGTAKLPAVDGSQLTNLPASGHTEEELQDINGAMVSGNTETGIAVTYQDEDGTTDYAVSVSTGEVAAGTLVIESEGIASNDNDTTIPTSAAVKDYVDDNVTGITNTRVTSSTELTITQNTIVDNYGQSGAITTTMPSAPEYTVFVQFIVTEPTKTWNILPQEDEYFYLNGTQLSADHKIVNNGAGAIFQDSVMFMSKELASSTWVWIVYTVQGTWSDGGL